MDDKELFEHIRKSQELGAPPAPPGMPSPVIHRRINWNRAWDLALFGMAGGLIYVFVDSGSATTAEQLALILFGAFMNATGNRSQ